MARSLRWHDANCHLSVRLLLLGLLSSFQTDAPDYWERTHYGFRWEWQRSHRLLTNLSALAMFLASMQHVSLRSSHEARSHGASTQAAVIRLAVVQPQA
jgi:hypothetical protein